MAVVPAFRKRILSVGSVPIYRMAYSTATSGDCVEYPAQESLQDDRFFRYYFNWRILWRATGTYPDPPCRFSMVLLTENDAQSIWSRIWDANYGPTGAGTSAPELAANEWAAGTLDIQSDFEPDKMIYPPGVTIRVCLNYANAGGQIDVRCLCAEARDPDELKQVIGHEISSAVQ